MNKQERLSRVDQLEKIYREIALVDFSVLMDNCGFIVSSAHFIEPKYSHDRCFYIRADLHTDPDSAMEYLKENKWRFLGGGGFPGSYMAYENMRKKAEQIEILGNLKGINYHHPERKKWMIILKRLYELKKPMDIRRATTVIEKGLCEDRILIR